MVTILPALRQVREDLVKLLDRKTVERLCDELGHGFRHRDLDPYTTLHLFVLQVVNSNTAMTHLPHLSGKRFTASAYCQARQRLPLVFFERLVNRFVEKAAGRTEPVSPCRIGRDSRRPSVNRVTRSRAAAFRQPTSWLSWMRTAVFSGTSLPLLCEHKTLPWCLNNIPSWQAVTCLLPIAASAHTPIWP